MLADQKPRYNPFRPQEFLIGSPGNDTEMRSAMTRKRLIAALMGGAFALSCACFAQDKASVHKTPDKTAIATENARQLLILMDTDKNGKISKQEWMNFMSAEFDRLDADHSGELDPHELLASRVTIHRVRPSDLGK